MDEKFVIATLLGGQTVIAVLVEEFLTETRWSYPAVLVQQQISPNGVDMSDAEHAALAEQLVAARCRVVITMNPGTVYQEVLSGPRWHHSVIEVRGMHGTVKRESLIANFPLPALSLFEPAPAPALAEAAE
jgi:hypothetical protein